MKILGMRESVTSRDAGMHITHTYGFPIVPYCRKSARPSEIPVMIGDRTMDPSEIAVESSLRTGGLRAHGQTLFAWGMKRQCTMCNERGGGGGRYANDDEQ